MPRIVVGGIKMIDHQFWEYYYGSSTSQPDTLSGFFTDYNNISKTSKIKGTQNYRPDNSNLESKDYGNNKKNINKLLKLTIDRPSLRYYFNDLDTEKTDVNNTSDKLKPITHKESEKIMELPIPNDLIKKYDDYTTTQIDIKPKKKKSEEKFKFNYDFDDKKTYTEKYNKHFPLVMADSIYIPEIQTRFELNRKTNWYEPTLKYNFN